MEQKARVFCYTLVNEVWVQHCKEDSNYVFPEIKLRGLVPLLNLVNEFGITV
jgi:hypothetical protein